MAESVLDKIVGTKEGREVFKNLSETNKTIQLMYKHQLDAAKKQEKWEKDKEKDRKKKEQDEKRKKGDPIFQQLFGKKNSEEEKKAKKGLVDLIKDAAIGGLQVIGGLLTKIVTPMIGGLGKVFTSIIGSAIKGLAPILANVFRLALGKMITPIALPAAGAVAAAVGIGLAGKHVTDNMKGGTQAFLDKHDEITKMLVDGGLTPNGSVQVGRGGSRNPTKPEQVELARKAKERRDKLNELQKQRDEEIKAIPKSKGGSSSRSGKSYTDDEKAKHDEIMRKYDEMAAKLQTGGHVNVPGSGSGDKIPMWLPPDSFVMNRNAAAMLQSGGLVPTLLEPGEKVFGPGQWGPMEMMMNSMVPRFQTGGEVKDNPNIKTNGDKTLFTLATTNKLINRGEGRCTESVAHTLDANKIKNPTTNADPNNPRGYAIQFVNKFGWKSVGGSPTPLSGADGSASLGVMPQKDYISNASSGNVPSGSLVFSTKHNDWFGNSSPGYDTAIARNGGKNLWNGKMNGDSIYGAATKSAIVLVPSDSTLKGNFASSSSSGEDGNAQIQPPGLGLGIMGQLTGMGAVGKALKDLLGGYKKALGNSGWIIDMLSGASQEQQPAPSSSGISGESPALSRDMMKSAKEMVEYVRSKGLSDAHAKGLIANAIRESSLNPAHDKSTGAGLFQWTDTGGRRQRMKAAVPNFATNWRGQIDYALTEDYGPKWKSSKFSSASDAANSFLNGFLRSADRAGDQQKNIRFLESIQGFQKGGVVNLSRSGPSSSNWKQNQQEFANQIAKAASNPSIVVVPTGGGSSSGSVGAPDVSPNQLPPSLPDGPSSAQAIDYFYRFAMGAAY